MEPSTGELLFSGIKLMLIGMTIVYLFLALLVWVINVTAGLIQRYSPEVPTHLQPPSDGGPSSESVRREVIAAISAAIHQYQKKRS